MAGLDFSEDLGKDRGAFSGRGLDDDKEWMEKKYDSLGIMFLTFFLPRT